MRRRWLGLAWRFAVSALLAAWLLGRIDVAAALRLLETVRTPLLLAAVLSMLLTHGVNCLRWRWCLLDEGRRVRFRAIIFSYWTSLFVGMALPTEYGGDLLRIKDVRSRLQNGSTAVAGVLWSRLSGIGATFFVFSLAGLGRLERLAELSMLWVWAISVAACLALAAFVFLPSVCDLASRVLERCPGPDPLRGGALGILRGVRAIAGHRVYGWRIAALALVAQILMIVTNTLYACALHQSVQVLDMALVVPVVSVSSMLPVSLGGIGVKETAFVLCLSALGLSAEGALSVALLNRLALLALALAGGCLMPFRRRLLGQ